MGGGRAERSEAVYLCVYLVRNGKMTVRVRELVKKYISGCMEKAGKGHGKSDEKRRARLEL